MIELSIVIPAYNEADRIGPTLAEVRRWIGDRTDVEVMVVDDGSTDGTAELVESLLSDTLHAGVLRVDANTGKGNAVRVGMLAATGRQRMFIDADGATPVTEFDRLIAALDATGGRGIAFGSIATGESVEHRQLWVRSLGGRLGNWLTRVMVLPGVRDTQRGCKVMSAALAEAVFPRCVIDGWGFDVELLALARRLGQPLTEVPIRWSHIAGGHITASSYLTTMRDLLVIRRRLRGGAYDLTGGAPDVRHNHVVDRDVTDDDERQTAEPS